MDHGTLSYNNYDFGPLTEIDVKTEPVYDEADRSVMYVRHSITAKGIVAADGTHADQDSHMEAIRQKLTKPGQPLELSAKGFGPGISVNQVDGPQDVDFGPKPRMLSWIPVGHTESAEVVWQCDVHLPECTYGYTTGVAGLNYSISYTINQRGFTTRTITGHLLIAMTRKGTGIPDTADAYRSEIEVPHLKNFHRTQDYQLSQDKRRLDFVVIDTEIESPNAWPAGVTEISGTCETGVNPFSSVRIDNLLRLEVELAHDQPRVRAWDIFRHILLAKLNAYPSGTQWIIESVRVQEELFSNKLSFTSQWRVVAPDGNSPLNFALSNGGMFSALDFNWDDWIASMTGAASQRGYADLAHNKADEKLIDLCNPASPNYTNGNTLVIQSPPGDYNGLCNPLPSPEKSYVHFEAELTKEHEYRPLVQTTLGNVTVSKSPLNPNNPDATLNPIDLSAVETIVSEAAPGMMFRWSGYVERIGYPIPEFDIADMAGVYLIKLEDKVVRKNKGDAFCRPLYAMAFNYLYQVKTQPTFVIDDGDKDPTGGSSSSSTP